jgi:hypothetical protein
MLCLNDFNNFGYLFSMLKRKRKENTIIGVRGYSWKERTQKM